MISVEVQRLIKPAARRHKGPFSDVHTPMDEVMEKLKESGGSK
ncbi:MAG: hypothetical protein ACRELZ_15610 [Candidatus Rokuibacteriota bacterium]